MKKKPFIVDQIASDIEDFLTKGCIIPVIGSLPAVLKSLFGVVQCLAACSTLVFSIPYCYRSSGRELFINSLKHIVHGIANILSGIICAIPLVGTLVAGFQLINKMRDIYIFPVYQNKQSHKFFAYKSIEEATWERIEPGDERSIPIKAEEIPEIKQNGGLVRKAILTL